MGRFASLIVLIFCLPCVAGSHRAVTLEEIRLMLRSGFSSESIIQERLVRGKVYGRFDAQWEKEFRALNASPKLLETLKSREYAVSEWQQQAWEENHAQQRLLPTASQIEGERIAKEKAAINQERTALNQKRVAQQRQVTSAPQQNVMTSSFAGPLQRESHPSIASTQQAEKTRWEIEDEARRLRGQNAEEAVRKQREIEKATRSAVAQSVQEAERARGEIAEATRLLNQEGERMRRKTQEQIRLMPPPIRPSRGR